ncbi:MAG: BglII/BstYI family type II restriction endonuclease [Dehalococcoidia bacterium]
MNFQGYDILRSEYPHYYSDIVDVIGSFQGPLGRGVPPPPAKAMQDLFVAKGWGKEAPVASGKALKFDLRKGPIAVEIQLANPADCYNDLLKFLLAYNLEVIEVGVEVV